MNRLIHKAFLLFALLTIMHPVFAQTQDAETLHETARSLMRQGDFENAMLVLNKALVLKPGNLNFIFSEAHLPGVLST